MTDSLKYYGIAFVQDPILGGRGFAFIKRQEDDGRISRFPMTREYIRHLQTVFLKDRASREALDKALQEVVELERAHSIEENGSYFPQVDVFIQCDDYRKINDPELGLLTVACLRRKFSSGITVRHLAWEGEVSYLRDHFKEHAENSDAQHNHGQPKEVFAAAALLMDEVLSAIKQRDCEFTKMPESPSAPGPG